MYNTIEQLETALDMGVFPNPTLPEWEVYHRGRYVATLPARDKRSAIGQAARLCGGSTDGVTVRESY